MKPPLLIDLTAIAQTATAPTPAQPRLERTRFCSRCAGTAGEPEGGREAYGFDRVCESCGMGVMLTTPRRALPGPGAAFLIVTREGRIAAVSEAAERLVGEESSLVESPVTRAVAVAEGPERLLTLLARAAGGGREVVEITVTLAGRDEPLRARVASCGPPRAALLVLERSPL